jgi:hypothetical protein
MRRTAVLLLPVLALVAGCGSAALDATETEQAIRASVAERFDVAVDAVRCPEDVEAQAGARLRCTVRAADGSHGRVVVTQDEDGDVEARTPFLRMAGIERLVARGVQERSGARRVRLACPDIVVVHAGRSFTCRGRADGRRARVRVTQQDAEGSVRWELVRR